MNPLEMLITSGVRAAMARSPDKVALTCVDQGQRTYREFVAQMDAVRTTASTQWSLKRGDNVALVSPNCLEYFEIVAGLSEAGIAVATVNPRLSAPEVEQIVRDAQAPVVIYHPSCEHLVLPRLDDLKLVEIGSPLAEPDSTIPIVAQSEDLYSIPYTSGTTGHPKGVMISHRARVMTFYGMAAEYCCYHSHAHFLALTPLCHGAGFAFGFAPLFFGGRVDLFPKFDPEQMLRHLAKGEVDGIFMVPTQFQALFALDHSLLAKCKDQVALRTIISNASALPQPMKEKIIPYFGEGILHETYGSTEAGIVTNLRPRDQLRKANCVGPAFVENIISLRDEDGNEVPANTPGELFSRSPTAFSGYWNRPDATKEACQDGWVSVGDIAVRDDEGYIYIVDRKKDMIISGGINVYPREIENVLITHPEITEIAVFGVSDDKWGEAICAAAVLEPNAKATPEAIIEWLEPQIARYKLPRMFHLVESLPRNANGKVLKRVLSEDYANATQTAA